MPLPRLVIVHGYMAAPEHHWFPWLQQQAELAGLQVVIPRLPEPEAPRSSEWLDALEHTIGRPDENTWLAGHSLGCITLLNYLAERYPGTKAGGLLLVSGFSEPVPGLEKLEGFVRTPPDLSQVISGVKHRAVIASLDDEIVPAEFSLRLSQQLAAPFYALPGSGHFLGREGFTELPLINTLLRQFLEANVISENV